MGPWLRVCVWSLVGLVPLVALADPPASMPGPVIGVLDIDEIQQDSLAAKAVRTQAEKYRQDFQQQSSVEESALRAAQNAIEQERKTLTPSVLAEKARAFDASVADYKRRELARRRAFEKSFNGAMGRVQQAMVDAVRQVAKAHGANLILPRGQVFLFDDTMNMTKEIIALMDKALPSVDLPPPQLEPEVAQPATSPAQAAALKKKN